MTKYCYLCEQRIKRNELVDMSKLDNPLINGYWCRSCFLVVMYKTLDNIRMDINSISARLDFIMKNSKSGENGNGKEGNSTTHL